MAMASVSNDVVSIIRVNSTLKMAYFILHISNYVYLIFKICVFRERMDFLLELVCCRGLQRSFVMM
jgi:hypothetical protein